MKKYTSLSILITTTLLLSLMGSAQQPVAPASDTSVRETAMVIPPLMDLIDSALKHNAMVRYRDLEVIVRESNLQSENIYWTRNLGVQADTRYGTFDNFVSGTSNQSTTLLATTARQFNYGAGVYIKLPLGDLLNRRNQLKAAKAQVAEAHELAEAQKDEIRQLVIKLYQDLLLRQRLLNIAAHSLGTARVNGDMVEKEFRNGVIPIVEYVRVSDIVTKAEADYELAKASFTQAKLLLETIVGFSLTQPVTTKQP